MSTTEQLPPELIARIFSLLDPTTVITCRQVCRRWRFISTRYTNPLYLPRVLGLILTNLQFRDALRARLVCKLWQDGSNMQTLHETLVLNGRTDIDACDRNLLICNWNPFPSRIVRLEVCRRRNENTHFENDPEYGLVQQFGEHILYLQAMLHHCEQVGDHFTRVLSHLTNLRGLVITESSLKRWKPDGEDGEQRESHPLEIPALTNLKFLKLDDSESKLQYYELYKKIIESSPNLNHLDIHGYFHCSMEIVKLLPRLSSLTTLRMDAEDPYTIEILEVLHSSQFPLKSLSLQLSAWGDESECHYCTDLLHSIFRHFSETLESLELKLNWDMAGGLNFEPEILTTFLSSKYLVGLTKFKLVGFHGSLNFLKEFVSLKSVMIVDYNPECQDVLKNIDCFHEMLPQLKQVFLPKQTTFSSLNNDEKTVLRNFMMDSSWAQKYCGLYLLQFP